MSTDQSLLEQICRRHLARGQVVVAIKDVQAFKFCDLKEAKDYVEALMERLKKEKTQ